MTTIADLARCYYFPLRDECLLSTGSVIAFRKCDCLLRVEHGLPARLHSIRRRALTNAYRVSWNPEANLFALYLLLRRRISQLSVSPTPGRHV